jgi:hypothetical protein
VEGGIVIPLPDGISADDVNQWIGSGVCLVRTRANSDPVPAVMLEAHPGDPVRVRLHLPLTDRTTTVNHTSCFAHWPELGSFNDPGGYAVHMERVAVRQYRRTLNDRCVRLTIPWRWQVTRKAQGYVDTSVTQDRLLLPWTSLYPANFDEAEAKIAEGRCTVALNNRLIIAGLADVGKRLLFLDGVLAASVQGGVLHPACSGPRYDELLALCGGRYHVIGS